MDCTRQCLLHTLLFTPFDIEKVLGNIFASITWGSRFFKPWKNKRCTRSFYRTRFLCRSPFLQIRRELERKLTHSTDQIHVLSDSAKKRIGRAFFNRHHATSSDRSPGATDGINRQFSSLAALHFASWSSINRVGELSREAKKATTYYTCRPTPSFVRKFLQCIDR